MLPKSSALFPLTYKASPLFFLVLPCLPRAVLVIESSGFSVNKFFHRVFIDYDTYHLHRLIPLIISWIFLSETLKYTVSLVISWIALSNSFWDRLKTKSELKDAMRLLLLLLNKMVVFPVKLAWLSLGKKVGSGGDGLMAYKERIEPAERCSVWLHPCTDGIAWVTC